MIKDSTKKPETPSETTDKDSSAPEATDSSIVDASEAAEFVDKLPSEAGEKASEDKTQSSDGTAASQGDDDDNAAMTGGIAEIKFPTRNAMKREIRNAIISQEGKFMNEAKKYSRNGDYFELNNVLAKIRGLRFILSELVRSTYENIKDLWIKYVYKTG